jgi:hypothetical protein
MHWVVRGACFLFSLLSVTSPDFRCLDLTLFLLRAMPKASADGGIGPENPKNFFNNAIPTENANDTAAADPAGASDGSITRSES